MCKNAMRPVHPGEVLREDFQSEMGVSAAALARALGVSATSIHGVLSRRRGVSAGMALRLATCLDTTPEFWLNLQTAFDLRTAELNHGEEIHRQVQRLVACA
ncbi:MULTISPECIES: HigA family addiction module antitoxin [Pseudomonas]|uniref:HigA family addiction module antitoxin n=1 Tax=Pseudomonas TaxID=286 RepID=UPI0004748335|nr:HigA family addiction module antitoxin [Pseudomonas donghuensis]MBS7599479.1 HigA family addiction module antidote protein [Pseudomonas sp. RC2C2]MBF4209132.1 addiction module antidote protein, HigA family [Pseudomonas donghuensis]MCP6695124.1 HigA family addiction module antitoxin [Pseudomonas donghuensis]PJY97929.1 addiction module antidote protein, HigA family [Pseudomonas donghuensis]UVL27004.1 HigA family addiction module antitoxin [Pseudomonas donghuensis]